MTSPRTIVNYVGWVCIIVSSALLVGCSGPLQVGPSNYRLIQGLRTAISARRTDWLEAAAKVASDRHASDDLNDEQFGALEAIVAQARAGRWEEAESEVIRLAKAQKPSAEEIEQSKAKKKTGP